MLRVHDVNKSYQNQTVLKEVNFEILCNEFVCLVGESGSGKSTTAEIIMGIQSPTSGLVEKEHCCTIQYIYQNPERSFNPYWTMGKSLREPLILKKEKPELIKQKIEELMDKADLPMELLAKKPSQCSGGQKQRLAIIRALLMNPKLLIADEITSALDPQSEKLIINLLKKFQMEFHMSVLYITHRIQSVSNVADRMMVLEEGTIVESGPASQILYQSKHPYTKKLVEACFYFENRTNKKLRGLG
jgi:peptide/nickel transport system ATP-binding protein